MSHHQGKRKDLNGEQLPLGPWSPASWHLGFNPRCVFCPNTSPLVKLTLLSRLEAMNQCSVPGEAAYRALLCGGLLLCAGLTVLFCSRSDRDSSLQL